MKPLTQLVVCLAYSVLLFGSVGPCQSAIVFDSHFSQVEAGLQKVSLLRRGKQGQQLARTNSDLVDSLAGQKSDEATIPMWRGMIMACIVSIAMVLGATVVFFMPEGGPPPSASAFSFSLAAGVMVAVAAEMLVPSAGKSGFAWLPILIFCSGLLTCAAICKLMDCFVAASAEEKLAMLSPREYPTEPLMENDDEDRKKRLRLTMLLFISLTLHHFPEGFAVAVTSIEGVRLGVWLCIAIAFHSIPEGIALAVSVYGVTKSYGQSFLWNFCSGLTAPLGALCAAILLQAYLASTPNLLHHLYVAVAGIMCYVALAELMPEAIATRCWMPIIVGFLLGVVVMLATRWFLDFAIDEGHIELRSKLFHQQMLY